MTYEEFVENRRQFHQWKVKVGLLLTHAEYCSSVLDIQGALRIYLVELERLQQVWYKGKQEGIYYPDDEEEAIRIREGVLYSRCGLEQNEKGVL